MNADKLTRDVIAKMLRENTGRSILDSGDYYGRHYERNAYKDFESAPYATLDVRYKYIDYTVSLYHFLCQALSYNKSLTNSFYAWEHAHKEELEYLNWYETLDRWIKHKGYTVIDSDNTYNSGNNLSQGFYYRLVSGKQNARDMYDTEFVILMIHNGCDIRGGYTQPKMFDCDSDELLSYSNGYIRCENDHSHSWYTDDSYNWYSDDSSIPGLKSFEILSLDDCLEELESDEEYQADLERQMKIDLTKQSLLFERLEGWSDYRPEYVHPVKAPLQAAIYYDDDNTYCPVCAGLGKLSKLLP